MGGDDNIGVQHRSEEGSIRICPTSDMPTNLISEKVAGMAMTSLPMFKSSNGTDPFFVWDPLVSLTQSATFCGSASMVPELSNHPYPLENHGISSTSRMVQYPSESAIVEMVPKMSGYGSGSFSEMVGSFRLTECGQIPNGGCLPIYPSDEARGTSSGGAQSQEDCQVSDEKAMGASPCGKRRKRGVPDNSNSPLNPNKSPDGEQQRGPFGESSELQQQNDKKQKVEEDGLGAKDTYVHVRAKRGQATNSHSLAERVRREKISERMKMLQELVPGCNKITGKAVMLDEIINYVQSLQQQVEFLSMKLATVNPDVNIDIDRLLPKDVLHSRVGDASILGFGPGMNSAHPYPHGISHGTLPHPMPGTSQLHSMPHQVVWDGEFQNVFQMGYDSNPVNNTVGANGRPKSEI